MEKKQTTAMKAYSGYHFFTISFSKANLRSAVSNGPSVSQFKKACSKNTVQILRNVEKEILN